jgi:excisionase family DNA binding protein
MEGEWFVTVSCAANVLGCKRSDIYDLVTRGFLGFIQMPSKEIKISTESLAAFFQSPDIACDQVFPNSLNETSQVG